MADIIGVTKSTMSKYENDLCIPNADILCAIANALKTSTDFLVGRIDDDAPPESGDCWMKLSAEECKAIEEARLLSPINKGKLFERITVLLEDQTKSNNIKMD